MKRWWLLVVWCLSLALPLQGLAAVAPLLPLGSMHQVPSDPPVERTSLPCHGDGHVMDAADPVAVVDDADPGSSGGHPGCAQCAVCHASTAPAPQVMGLPGPESHGDAPPAWLPPFLSSVDPDGLDRPPRTLLV